MTGNPAEKRDAERVQTGQVRGEVTVYESMIIQDMSDSGAQVETRFPLHLDSLHDFRLSLGARSVIVKGRIVRCHVGNVQEGGILYRTGIEFVEPSEHALAAIRAFVEAKRVEALATPIVEAEVADD
jgi:PilZ domain